jgi:hypothetical protein
VPQQPGGRGLAALEREQRVLDRRVLDRRVLDRRTGIPAVAPAEAAAPGEFGERRELTARGHMVRRTDDEADPLVAE